MPVCWKARAVLPKRDAQTLSDALEQLEPTPVVSAFELGERGLWEVEAFFSEQPDEGHGLTFPRMGADRTRAPSRQRHAGTVQEARC